MPRETKSAMIARLNAKTELQWFRLNRTVVDYANYMTYFDNVYYAEANTREMTPEEVEEFQAKRKADRDRRKKQRQDFEDYLMKRYDVAAHHLTAYQFLQCGRVVNDDAKPVLGSSFHIKHGNDEYYLGMSADYYYYNDADTTVDEHKAAELLKTFPANGYDGRKWW